MNAQQEMIEQKLKSIILKNASLGHIESDITDESDLIDDFQFDSILITQLVIDIEENFEVRFEDDFLLVEFISKYKGLKDYILDMISRKGE